MLLLLRLPRFQFLRVGDSREAHGSKVLLLPSGTWVEVRDFIALTSTLES